jgi:integrase/recombinase XerD
MEVKLNEPKSNAKTVLPADFEKFINRIRVGKNPDADPFGFRDRLMMLMFRESGLRCGEMLGIRMEDLDFAANGVYIRFRADNENGSRAKAGYGSERFVDLPAEVLGLLDIYLTKIWVNANSHSHYLWLVLKRNAVNGEGQKTFGTALTQIAVNEMFAYYSERSGIKIHPHMLRHTHATDLVRFYLSKGEPVDWKFIADRLGHSTVVTTMQTYVHLTKEDGKKAYKMYLEKKEEIDAKRRQSKYASA